ncbi:MAG TPA: monovalent cation/H(+) antiporter subunit G [Pirellulales bacterium]|nr:monovalent cation/H(+) antiporter subunit G [Pirellulales bacterium]
MTLADWIALGLLTAGAAVVCLASFGLFVYSSALDRLHLLSLCGTCGLGLICAAVCVRHPTDQFGVKAALLAVITWCFAPVLSHVQAALAYRVRTSDRQDVADLERDRP